MSHVTPRYGFHVPDGTDGNNPPADIGQLAADVEGRLGAVEDTFPVSVGFSPTIRSGSATGTVWNVDDQQGWRRKAYGVVQAWSQSRNGDNGPAYAGSLPHYIVPPLAPLSGFKGSLGTFAYLTAVGEPQAAGHIVFGPYGNAAARLMPTGGPGFITSNQYLLVCNWHYPAA